MGFTACGGHTCHQQPNAAPSRRRHRGKGAGNECKLELRRVQLGDPIAPRAQMNVNYNKDRQLDSEAGTALTGANKCK